MVRRLLASLVATLVAALAIAVFSAAPAGANAGDYYSRINSLRASNGLGSLQVDGTLAGTAAGWTSHMASTGVLAHDPNLGSGVSGWLKLGENVGYGDNTDVIWNAFLNSPAHRNNLLDPEFTHIGVSVVVDGSGTQWTTHRFMKVGGAPAPAPAPTAPPATAPAPAPAPAPTAPPATAPVAEPAPAPVPEATPAGLDTPPEPPTPPPTPPPADPGRVSQVLTALRALG